MIRTLRESSGLTQIDLANKIGKSENYIKKLESNFMAANPTLDTIGHLAEAFNMCPNQLFCDICKTYFKLECSQDHKCCK